ncbi:MAG: hypothetical protein A2W04_01160 [Betaproteobacteria bacterium RBG_16_64_9]|nr:MAG: hypothetical protein A2W04_01160 [Betaproteobacteria bacterium RBG_16_64_9]
MQALFPHRLGQRVTFDRQAFGHLRELQPFIEQLLRFADHLRSQHRGAPRLPLGVKTARSLFSVALDCALDAYQRHPEGTRNLRLLGMPNNAEL